MKLFIWRSTTEGEMLPDAAISMGFRRYPKIQGFYFALRFPLPMFGEVDDWNAMRFNYGRLWSNFIFFVYRWKPRISVWKDVINPTSTRNYEDALEIQIPEILK